MTNSGLTPALKKGWCPAPPHTEDNLSQTLAVGSVLSAGPIPCNELREEQKQTISALGTLVAV
nr:hypothetical protein [Yersinia alsatica]